MPFRAGVKVQRAAVLFSTESREEEPRPPPFCLPPGLTPAGPARGRGAPRGCAPTTRVPGTRLASSRARPPAPLPESSGSGGCALTCCEGVFLKMRRALLHFGVHFFMGRGLCREEQNRMGTDRRMVPRSLPSASHELPTRLGYVTD